MTGPRPQRIMCAWAFFSPSKHSSSPEVRYSARQKSRSASGGDVVVANQVPGAKLSLWILVPSNSGFCELGKHDTCLRHLSWVPTVFCRRLARCPLWAPSPSGNFPWPRVQMPEDFPSMHEQDRSSGIIGWDHWPMTRRSQWINFLPFCLDRLS